MQISGDTVGIIADDLTGACDTGLQFFLEGGQTQILLDPQATTLPGNTQTWVINTQSRHLEPYDAVAAVRKCVHQLQQRYHLDHYYKKIDSTLRGHIAQECLAILDELNLKAAVIAPAYPDQGRRTVGGYQLVHGLPLGQTETARDPSFPVRQSHLPTLLTSASQADWVGHVTLSTTLDGAGPILRSLQDQMTFGKRLIVVDACSDTDLEQLSLAINKLPSEFKVLPCGSAGWAKALSKKWGPGQPQDFTPTPIQVDDAPLFAVIGSNSQVTRTQLKRFLELPQRDERVRVQLVQLTPAQILQLDPVKGVTQRVIQLLKDGFHVALSSTWIADTVENTRVLAQDQQIAPDQLSRLATHVLADITKQVTDVVHTKLVLSGGDTALAVCKALDIQQLKVLDEIETSVPLMRDNHGRWVVTKSGGFGHPDCMIKLLRYLQQHTALPEGVSHA